MPGVLEEALAVGAVLETEPVRRLPGLGKAPSCILAAAGMLAPMVLNAGARDGLHCTGKPDQLVAHRNISLQFGGRFHSRS